MKQGTLWETYKTARKGNHMPNIYKSSKGEGDTVLVSRRNMTQNSQLKKILSHHVVSPKMLEYFAATAQTLLRLSI